MPLVLFLLFLLLQFLNLDVEKIGEKNQQMLLSCRYVLDPGVAAPLFLSMLQVLHQINVHFAFFAGTEFALRDYLHVLYISSRKCFAPQEKNAGLVLSI